jgi:hypothetical protein
MQDGVCMYGVESGVPNSMQRKDRKVVLQDRRVDLLYMVYMAFVHSN